MEWDKCKRKSLIGNSFRCNCCFQTDCPNMDKEYKIGALASIQRTENELLKHFTFKSKVEE